MYAEDFVGMVPDEESGEVLYMRLEDLGLSRIVRQPVIASLVSYC